MKFTIFFTIFLSIFILITLTHVIANLVPLRAIQCRTCSEEISCSSTQNPKDWQIEDCPDRDHNCNLVWEKSKAGHVRLIYGGCSNNRISICSKDTENNDICISTCEGNLCNESIDFNNFS